MSDYILKLYKNATWEKKLPEDAWVIPFAHTSPSNLEDGALF